MTRYVADPKPRNTNDATTHTCVVTCLRDIHHTVSCSPTSIFVCLFGGDETTLTDAILIILIGIG